MDATIEGWRFVGARTARPEWVCKSCSKRNFTTRGSCRRCYTQGPNARAFALAAAEARKVGTGTSRTPMREPQAAAEQPQRTWADRAAATRPKSPATAPPVMASSAKAKAKAMPKTATETKGPNEKEQARSELQTLEEQMKAWEKMSGSEDIKALISVKIKQAKERVEETTRAARTLGGEVDSCRAAIRRLEQAKLERQAEGMAKARGLSEELERLERAMKETFSKVAEEEKATIADVQRIESETEAKKAELEGLGARLREEEEEESQQRGEEEEEARREMLRAAAKLRKAWGKSLGREQSEAAKKLMDATMELRKEMGVADTQLEISEEVSETQPET